MSNQKHTPGPWHVGSGNLAHPHLDRVRAGDFVVFLGNCKGAYKEEWEANARLIAAAPELLEALELAQATIERLERHAPGSANGTLDVVRAAIAKSEGTTP